MSFSKSRSIGGAAYLHDDVRMHRWQTQNERRRSRRRQHWIETNQAAHDLSFTGTIGAASYRRALQSVDKLSSSIVSNEDEDEDEDGDVKSSNNSAVLPPLNNTMTGMPLGTPLSPITHEPFGVISARLMPSPAKMLSTSQSHHSLPPLANNSKFFRRSIVNDKFERHNPQAPNFQSTLLPNGLYSTVCFA